MRTFVTGGTGFLGSHLVDALLEAGHEVRCLVRNELKWLSDLPITIVRGDLQDKNSLIQGMDGVDAVYHVAALTRAPHLHELVRANVDGTMAVLDAAAEANVPNVLVTSSQAAVGPSGDGPLSEEAPCRPLSDYGRSKAEMERRVRTHNKSADVVIVRPPSVYGPREADIFGLVKFADRFRMLPVVGKGDRPRLALVYVRDLVDGMMSAVESGGQTYFLGGPRNYSWDDIRGAIRLAIGHGALAINVPQQFVGMVGGVMEGIGRLAGAYPAFNRQKAREAREAWLISSEKARAAFGYSPGTSLEEGMHETVRWYRDNHWL